MYLITFPQLIFPRLLECLLWLCVTWKSQYHFFPFISAKECYHGEGSLKLMNHYKTFHLDLYLFIFVCYLNSTHYSQQCLVIIHEWFNPMGKQLLLLFMIWAFPMTDTSYTFLVQNVLVWLCPTFVSFCIKKYNLTSYDYFYPLLEFRLYFCCCTF